MSMNEIDALLQRYLDLLDQYINLRKELTTLQSSIHQDIARANFSSDRGIRYGQDYYDSRMRAARVVQIQSPTVEYPETFSPTTTFTILPNPASLGWSDLTISKTHGPIMHPEKRPDVHNSDCPTEGITSASTTSKDHQTWHDPHTANPGARDSVVQGANPDGNPESEPEPQPQTPPQTPPPSQCRTLPKAAPNALHMFGLLVPSSLRAAQAGAIAMVEKVIPALASVDAEMRDVEIRIRRARKFYRRHVESGVGKGRVGVDEMLA